MPSEVDICNLALSHLGDSATVASINPAEGSAQAEHCAIFYPQARDTLLEMHSWSFATRRASAALLDSSAYNYRYAYAVPNRCLRILSVHAPTACLDEPSMDFELEADENGSRILLTDMPDAVMRYTVALTDPTKFSPLFVDALAWLLASHLAGPLMKGDTGAAAARSCYATFRQQFSAAAVSDANQRQVDPRRNERAASWIEARNGFAPGRRWGY